VKRLLQRWLIGDLAARVEYLEMILMQDPGFRDRAKFNSMLQHVVDVAKIEGML
jgi:hypothetical protein